MKYEVKFTNQFRRDLKLAKKQSRGLDRMFDAVSILADGDTLDAKYRDHDLSGNYKGTRECHIEPDWLLVYELRNDVLTERSRNSYCRETKERVAMTPEAKCAETLVVVAAAAIVVSVNRDMFFETQHVGRLPDETQFHFTKPQCTDSEPPPPLRYERGRRHGTAKRCPAWARHLIT